MFRTKRGLLDDFFDFVFTVTMLFFILLFVRVYVTGGDQTREQFSNAFIVHTETAENFLAVQQLRLQQGEIIRQQELDDGLREIRTLREESTPRDIDYEGLQ